MKYFIFYIFLIAQLIITISCEKEKVSSYVDYSEYSSVVGPEGKTIHYYESNSNIPDSLFPTLIIPENALTRDIVIDLSYRLVYRDVIPLTYTSISPHNILWYFNSEDISMNEPATLIIPYPSPDEDLLLDNYEYLFQLYRIHKDTSLSMLQTWEPVNEYSIDTSNNIITATIHDLNYGYCVLFPEIQRDDYAIINLSGDVEKTHFFASNFWYLQYDQSLTFAPGYLNEIMENTFRGFHYHKGISRYVMIGIEGTVGGSNVPVYYILMFEFAGNTEGTYVNNEMELLYLNTQLGEFYNENVTIEIYEYGKIGERVKGKVNGQLEANYTLLDTDTLDIEIEFNCIRLR